MLPFEPRSDKWKIVSVVNHLMILSVGILHLLVGQV